MALQGRAPDPASPGLIASLKRLGTAFVWTIHSRVELVAHEFERERLRVTRLLILAVIGVFFLMLGAITATILIIVLFWDSQRLFAIGSLTVLYLSLGGGLLLFAKSEAGRSTRPFASTIDQFKKDREYFARNAPR